jgi:lysozyme family protein
MTHRDMRRREMIRLAMGTSAGFFLTARSAAQPIKLDELLGSDLPSEILGLLPGKPLSLVRTVATILKLEKDADSRGLPSSMLSYNAGMPMVATESSLYQAALPRLVTLIDRSETSDPALADEAGSVLADVHASQHVVPDALKPAPKSAPAPIALSRARNFATLKAEYGRLFQEAAVRDEHAETVDWHFKMIRKYRERYEKVATVTSVPWYFIAAIHGLESSFNFRAHLHNGDFPLGARTRQVPAGRPLTWLPPSDWEASAKDALKLMGFTGQHDWSLERTLYRLEAYNGFGYRSRGVPTPYLWSFTNHYETGKFVSDGTWNPKARSQQCGSATILKRLADAGDVTFPGAA